MPNVLKLGAYRFFFYANDGHEPPHIHIEREAYVAKFWLNPVRLQQSGGFSRAEIAQLVKSVQQHQQLLLEKWYEFFGDSL